MVPSETKDRIHTSINYLKERVLATEDRLFARRRALHHEQKELVYVKDVFRKFMPARQTAINLFARTIPTAKAYMLL